MLLTLSETKIKFVTVGWASGVKRLLGGHTQEGVNDRKVWIVEDTIAFTCCWRFSRLEWIFLSSLSFEGGEVAGKKRENGWINISEDDRC